ncbi:MAG: hypothetical protein GY943_00565, partial [Chloroflexi bacterium]|nr:hypothetical protein [Chloroflexota bacterium]
RMITFGIGFGMAGIVLLWVMWPLLSNVANGGLDWYQADGVGEFSADLLALFIPPPNHLLSQTWPTLHRFSETVYPFGQSENIIYTGIIVLLLAVLGIKAEWKSRADVRLWVTVAIIASVFALGPLLRVVGKFISIGETPVIMPYAILMQLPFLSWGRTPARFHLTALFAISILAAFGMRWLLHKTKHQQWRKLLPVILLALILLDAAIVYPWPMADITVPDFYQTVAADERAVAVLDIPATDYVAAKYHMLYQMTHQHALVGGYRTRLPIAARESMDQLTADATSPEGDPSRLAEAGVGYVVLHRQFLEADELDEMASYMLTNFGSPAYEDELIVAFLIPEPNEVAPMPLESLR